MTGLSRLVWVAVAAVGLGVVVAHHVAYWRKTRPLSFTAFLETGGWIILVLVAITAGAGGMAHPSTRVVETAAAAVALLFIAIGGQFK